MLINITRKAEAEWASVDEPMRGDVDGKNKTFFVPVKDPRELLVLQDLVIVAPDQRIREKNARGEVVVDEPNGYSLTPSDADDDEEGVTVTFQKAPRIGTRVGFSALGRKVESAMCLSILPLTNAVQKRLEDRGAASRKKAGKLGEDTTLTQAVAPSRPAFLELVTDWTGVVEDGVPVPCSADTKDVLLDQLTPLDLLALCNIVVERSVAIQKERLRTRSEDEKNS